MRIIYFVLFLFLYNLSSAQQFILNEDFESTTNGSLPTGWTRLQEGGADGWLTGNNLESAYFQVPHHSVYCATNDDECNCNSSANFLITPSLDFSGLTSVLLRFDRYFTKRYGDNFYVKVSLDGGASWNTIDQITPYEDWKTEYVNLSDYAGMSNVLVAFFYTDNGFWASGAAVDNVEIFEPGQNEFVLNRVLHYPFVCPGDSADLKFTFTNLSDQTVENLSVEYYLSSTLLASKNYTGLNVGLANTVLLSQRFEVTTSGIYDFTIILKGVNGTSVNDTLHYRYFALSECEETKLLAEENTATWCGYCPEGDYLSDSLRNLYPGKFLPVSVHYSDVFSFSSGNEVIKSYFYTYPSMMFNRWLFESEDYVSVVNRYNWKTYAEKILSRKTPFNLSISGDLDVQNGYYSAVVHIRPNGKIIGDFSVNLFVVEDSLADADSSEFWQINSYNSVQESHFYNLGDTLKDYVHNGVLRYVAGGTWGYSGFLPDTMEFGQQYDVSFLVLLKPFWNLQNMKVYAVVGYTGENSVYERFIVSATGQSMVIYNNDLKTAGKLNVYPNPAGKYFTVGNSRKFDKIMLYNLQGELIKVYNDPADRNSLEGVEQGVYILKAVGKNVTYSAKLIKL